MTALLALKTHRQPRASKAPAQRQKQRQNAATLHASAAAVTMKTPFDRVEESIEISDAGRLCSTPGMYGVCDGRESALRSKTRTTGAYRDRREAAKHHTTKSVWRVVSRARRRPRVELAKVPPAWHWIDRCIFEISHRGAQPEEMELLTAISRT